MKKLLKFPIKKLLFLFLALVFYFGFTSQPSHAYFPDIGGGGGGGGGGGFGGFGGSDYSYDDYWENAVYGSNELNQESGMNLGFLAFLKSATVFSIGPKNKEYIAQAGNGAAGTIASLIGALYSSPPASSGEYFADIGQNIGFAKPVHAQGIGFEGLRPFLPLWKIFRNITYVFFTIIFVITGFAIMFRVKLNPQTTASLQNTLPKVVIAILLVTFSYAIAGFLIDFTYILISLFYSLFGKIIPQQTNITNINQFLSKNVFAFFNTILNPGELFGTVAESIGRVVQGLLGNLPDSGKLSFFGAGIGILASLIIAIAVVFSLFKLFLALLMSYISVVFAVIFSPLVLSLEAIPGQSGFKMWLKMIFSNLIVFPATALIFLIGGALVYTPTSNSHGWVAPFLGQGWSQNISPLIGLAIILVAPGIVAEVKKAISAPSIGELGAQAMQPMAAAWRTGIAPVTKPAGFYIEGMEKGIQQNISQKYIKEKAKDEPKGKD